MTAAPQVDDRGRRIVAMRERGLRFREISKAMGLSNRRVRQLYDMTVVAVRRERAGRPVTP